MNNPIVYGNNSALKSISERLLNLADTLNAAADVALECDHDGVLFVAFSLLEAASEHAHAWGENLPKKGLALADQPDVLQDSATAAIDRLGAFIEGAALAISKAAHVGQKPSVERQALIDSMNGMNTEIEVVRRAVESLSLPAHAVASV